MFSRLLRWCCCCRRCLMTHFHSWNIFYQRIFSFAWLTVLYVVYYCYFIDVCMCLFRWSKWWLWFCITTSRIYIYCHVRSSTFLTNFSIFANSLLTFYNDKLHVVTDFRMTNYEYRVSFEFDYYWNKVILWSIIVNA